MGKAHQVYKCSSQSNMVPPLQKHPLIYTEFNTYIVFRHFTCFFTLRHFVLHMIHYSQKYETHAYFHQSHIHMISHVYLSSRVLFQGIAFTFMLFHILY